MDTTSNHHHQENHHHRHVEDARKNNNNNDSHHASTATASIEKISTGCPFLDGDSTNDAFSNYSNSTSHHENSMLGSPSAPKHRSSCPHATNSVDNRHDHVDHLEDQVNLNAKHFDSYSNMSNVSCKEKPAALQQTACPHNNVLHHSNDQHPQRQQQQHLQPNQSLTPGSILISTPRRTKDGNDFGFSPAILYQDYHQQQHQQHQQQHQQCHNHEVVPQKQHQHYQQLYYNDHDNDNDFHQQDNSNFLPINTIEQQELHIQTKNIDCNEPVSKGVQSYKEMDLCIDNPQPSSPSPSPSPPFNETNHNIENNTCESFITTTMPSTQNNNNSNNAVAQARKHMNTLLKQQQTSENDVQEAQRKLIEAQNALQSCQSKRDIIQKQIEDESESLTDSLLKVKSTWNDMYFKLVEYKKKYGNCDVKRTLLPHEKEATPDLVTLGAWIGRNRLEVRKHPDRIEPYKITALNRLGFDFDPRESYWMDNYYRLKDYMAVHGQGKMPTRRKSALGVWCDGQIIAYNKFMSGNPSYITQRKIDLLNIIGFV